MHTSMQHKYPVLFIADWLSRLNHNINKDKDMPGMKIDINTIKICTNILKCMLLEEKWLLTLDLKHIGVPSDYIIQGWQQQISKSKKSTAILAIQRQDNSNRCV